MRKPRLRDYVTHPSELSDPVVNSQLIRGTPGIWRSVCPI